MRVYPDIDIFENELIQKYDGVLDQLLRDHTTGQNIFWATDNYELLGDHYSYYAQITKDLISGENGTVIMPRVKKDKQLQQVRSRSMAEVFTPSWICNAQNNLIDAAWFGKKNVFNKEVIRKDGSKTWYVNREKITFPKDKTWRKYILEKRLEIACGEAPYITSRYDTTTGEFIPVEKRIGILDRKLRVINENVDNSRKWLLAAQDAYKSTYGFEWQGDSLLLAREAMLMTFIENYALKFGKEPLPKSIKFIAYIISWNIWQMDGLKGIVPESCETTLKIGENLFGEKFTNKIECEGCQKNDLKKHNGIYCLINDWCSKDKSSGKKGLKIKFVDLLNKL